MNHFADTAPAEAATRDDDDEKSNDNPHDNHSEFAQAFETLLRRICHIVDDADERIVCYLDDCRRFHFILSAYQVQQEHGENR